MRTNCQNGACTDLIFILLLTPKKLQVMKKNQDEKVQKPYVDNYEMFTILKNDKTEGKFVILIAGGLATQKSFVSVKAAKEYIDSKPWDLLLSTVAAVCINLKVDVKSK